MAGIVDRNEEDGVYRLAYDREIDPTSSAIIAAVATVADTDPMDLDPLHPTIDLEVIDDLFDASTTGRRRSEVRVSFRFGGFEITATGREVVVVRST